MGRKYEYVSSSPSTLEQVYTIDSLFILLGCKAGLECFCSQIKQGLSRSVMPCYSSWQNCSLILWAGESGLGDHGMEESHWLFPQLLLTQDFWGWCASARWSPYTDASLTNGFSHDLMSDPELILVPLCCCPAASSSAYLDLDQFINFMHYLRWHWWFGNLETARGNFLFLTRNYSPHTAALHCPLQSKQTAIAPSITFAYVNWYGNCHWLQQSQDRAL